MEQLKTRRYELLVFLTGAVTLSLEVLASRIMTPFFGVSLYIWSGILSITLVFLAIGYRLGGVLSARLSRPSIELLFLAAPVASALAMAVSALVYPFAFPVLSQTNLVFGSFIAATLLLALPLIALSAMNPLLISLNQGKPDIGDGGAGRVFFISTMGSVFGVLFTAFLFIPNVTNFRAMLVLGFAVSSIMGFYILLSHKLAPGKKRLLLGAGLLTGALCGAVFATKDSYLKLVNSAFANQPSFRIIAEYTSVFGNIKVAELENRDGNPSTEKYFVQDGLVQNRTDFSNKSISMYTYVLESLVHGYAPQAKDIVVLGLGAGIVPRHFDRDGLNVSVVEINPEALRAASENFGFNKNNIRVFLEDARTFVRKCDDRFDAAVVDLFLGDNIPDYLMTMEFFGDLRKCIRPGGAMVMNVFFDSENDKPNKRLMATIASAFPNLFLSGIPGGNRFLVGASGTDFDGITVEAVNLPANIAQSVKYSVTSRQQIQPCELWYSKPISDDHNIFSLLFANANLAERKYLAGFLPPSILVN
jgi:predicted membrane-bound spermidine synthase